MTAIRTFSQLRESFRSDHRHGDFVLRAHEQIGSVVQRARVPAAHGVYVISSSDAGDEVLYIGKAGTICQDGSTKYQTIRKRMTMKQGGIYRNKYYSLQMESLGLPSLHFEWFVTQDETSRVPPFLAESLLLAAFLGEFGRLPHWNKSA